MELRLNSGQIVIDRRSDDGGVPPNVLEKVLGGLNAGARMIKAGVDLGQEVGLCNCVPIGSSRFLRVRRPGREWNTIFVIGREPEKTTFVTAVLVQESGGYTLVETYFGQARPADPGDQDALLREPSGFMKAKAEAEAFWRMNGLVLGSCDVRCMNFSCGALIHKGEVLACFDNKSEILCAACRAANTAAADEW